VTNLVPKCPFVGGFELKLVGVKVAGKLHADAEFRGILAAFLTQERGLMKGYVLAIYASMF
jgi:hypothetical protein